MRFKVLGHLQVQGDGPMTLVAPKPRQVLAMLLLNANRVTFVNDIALELWGSRWPASYSATLQTYVYQIRRMLDVPDSCAEILTRPRGYLIRVPELSVDAWEFEWCVDSANRCLDTDRSRACELLDRALGLWGGPVLADIHCGDVLSGFVARLEEMRTLALELSVEAGLRSGRHRELVGSLKQLVRQHPYHEMFHAQLVRALALSGRRHEARQTFREVAAMLQTSLGVGPSQCLRDALQLTVQTETAQRPRQADGYGTDGPVARLRPRLQTLESRAR